MHAPAALVAAAAALASPAGEPLVPPELLRLLEGELSGELAKESVIAITRHHRIQGSRGYRDAAQWVLRELRTHGFGEDTAWIESFPSDGKAVYQTWQSPSGWDIDSAELGVVEPFEERLVGYPEIAMSVVTYSNAGEATAPLVFVGSGTRDADYEGIDVEGKAVLATGYGGTVHRKAVLERGAAFVVCYLDDERALEHPDMLAYTGMWPRTEELERVTFGFNLTHRQGERLRGLLASGEEVVVHGTVRGTGLEPFFMDVVVAEIPGVQFPGEELLFIAHLDHPKESANDNASGSAAILDVARGLRALIDAGRLPAPARTLRFLWVPEFFGTMAYVDAHPELVGPGLGGRTLAAMNLDMVGEDTDLLHCRMEIARTPDSLPSALNDVVEDVAASVDALDVHTPRGSRSTFDYRMTGFAPGSDHMVLVDRKVPALMLWHSPDYTHHTSEDTPDKVDPVQLERAELIAAGSLWHLANLTSDQAHDLAWRAAARAAGELAEAGRKGHRILRGALATDAMGRWLEARNVVGHARFREVAHVRSVASFDGGATDELLAKLCARLDEQAQDLFRSLTEVYQSFGRPVDASSPVAVDERVPHRTTRGPLATDLLERRLPSERHAWYSSSGAPLDESVRFELVNFVDGHRTVSEIRAAASAEFGPLALESVSRFFDDLVSIGVVE